MFSSKKGFSLVELSIVLVILGLLVGGTIMGKSLIKAAQLRKVANVALQYQSALQQFKTKYEMLPGDMTNATQFWGTSNTGCPFGASVPTSGTCNGNGDGILGSLTDIDHLLPTTAEYRRLWEHLSRAELISNAIYSRGYRMEFGRNSCEYMPCSPYTRNSSATIVTIFQGKWHSVGSYRMPTSKDPNLLYLQIGGNNNGAGFGGYIFLSSLEMYNIDRKYDDGKPFSGRFTATYNQHWNACGVNATGQYHMSDNYVITGLWNGCVLFLDTGF